MAHDVMDIPWETISGENPDAPAPQAEPPKPESPLAPSDTPNPEDPPVPPPDAPPAGDPPPAPPAPKEPEPDHDPEDPTAKGRFRLEGPDAHFARLRREGVAAEDAIKIAYKQDTPPPDDAPPADDPLKAVNDELAEIRTKAQQFAKDESLVTEEYEALNERRAELIAKKQVLELQQAQAAEVARAQEGQQLQSEEAKSWEAAEGLFPDIKNENSALYKAVEKEWNEIAENPKHPLHTLTNLPELLTAQHAARLRIAPAAASPQQPLPAPPSKAPGPTPMQPVPGNVGINNPPSQLTDAQRAANFTQNLAKAGSMKEVGKLLDEGLFHEKEPQDFEFRM